MSKKSIAGVIALVAGFSFIASAMAATITFTTSLKQGSTGMDVKNLQMVLNMDTDTQVSTVGAGSLGNETSYFGPATKRAVVKFQEKYASEVLAPVGLTSGTGFVGPSTRSKLNMVAAGGVSTGTPTSSIPGCTSTAGFSPTTGQSCAGAVVTQPPAAGTTTTCTTVGAVTTCTTTGTTPAAGGLTVSASTQPANGLAVTSGARVPFTKITLMAGSSDVTVNGITVERTGAANDAVFAGVVLVDEDGTQFDIAKTFGSTHQAIVGGTFTVKAGTSKTLTIAGNMAASLTAYAGQVASISVVSVNTTGTVSGALPITGAQHTINSTLTIGTVTGSSSSYNPTAVSKEIGTTGYKFSAIRLTAGSAEDVRLKSMRFYQAGSAGSGDLSNVKIYVDGTAYDTTVSSDGKYYAANFGSGIVFAKGLAKDVWIAGDITGSGSAGRTIDFDIQKNTDIYVVGETYGYGMIAAGTVTTSTPSFNGVITTVSAGSFTSVTKATSVAAQNIAINLGSQPLGGYVMDITGEAISVQSHVFTIASTTPSGVATVASVLTNVSLYDENGAVVAGPVDAVAVTTGGALTQTVTFTDTVTYPVGKKTYTLKGKVPTGIANGATYITTATTMSSITGQTTGNTITSPTLAFAMNTMTVKSAALAVSQSTSPAAQTIVAGGTGVTFANFQLDASQSGEDVRLSSIPLTDTVGGAAVVTNLTTCQLFDGATALNTGSNVVNPSVAAATFTFDASLTIPKNTVKTLTLKCNVASGITGSFTWNMTATQISGLTVTGVISGSTVTATGALTTGTAQTVGTGSLVTSTSPSSPSYSIAAAGSTGVTAGVIRFRATNEAINLSRIGLKLTNTASSSASDLVQVSIWDGATQVGTATFTGTNTNATSTLSSIVVLPKDADKDLTVKVDFAQIGTGLTGVQGDLIAVDNNATADPTGTQGTGASSGTTLNATGSTAVSGVRLFKSFPTVAADSTLGGTGVIDGTFMKFKVTANANGGVGINQLKFTVATTSATVTALQLYGYTDAAYSTPISGFTAGAIHTTTQSAPLGTLTITPTAVINIPAGATYYFKLSGTITASATTYAVTSTLLGDSSYPSLAVNMGTSAGVASGNLVWSPNATTTSSATHLDWTNSYGVTGLPSSGLIQTRSN